LKSIIYNSTSNFTISWNIYLGYGSEKLNEYVNFLRKLGTALSTSASVLEFLLGLFSRSP